MQIYCMRWDFIPGLRSDARSILEIRLQRSMSADFLKPHLWQIKCMELAVVDEWRKLISTRFIYSYSKNKSPTVSVAAQYETLTGLSGSVNCFSNAYTILCRNSVFSLSISARELDTDSSQRLSKRFALPCPAYIKWRMHNANGSYSKSTKQYEIWRTIKVALHKKSVGVKN